jgi:Flp pilus assembly protein TadB
VLPVFGGSPAVWTTALCFFTGTVFVGYLYAHLVATRLSQRSGGITHLVVVGAAVVAALFTPANLASLRFEDMPAVLNVLMVLALLCGAPVFLLSTTTPLLSSWFAKRGADPWWLYAVSNAASLGGLVAYPFLIELTVSLPGQRGLIVVALIALAAGLSLVILGGFRARKASGEPAGAGIAAAAPALVKPTRRRQALWLFAACCRPVCCRRAGLLGGAGVMTAVGIVAPWAAGLKVLAVAGVSMLMFFAPDLWLSHRVQKYQDEIVRNLPDMLDMLTISVEAGLGFDAALAKLVCNTDGALAREFGRALQDVQAGSSRKEALRDLAERVQVSELAAFTAAITQADMFGISIAHVLHTQAGELRLRRRQRAEELAQKAPVKMVIPLVACILPATIIVILGPAAVKIAGMF